MNSLHDALVEQDKQRHKKSFKRKLQIYVAVVTTSTLGIFLAYSIASAYYEEMQLKSRINNIASEIISYQNDWNSFEERKVSCEATIETQEANKIEAQRQADIKRRELQALAKSNNIDLKEALGETYSVVFKNEEAETSHKTQCGKVTKRGWSDEASWIVQRAYDISDCDKTFVLLLEAENGMWTPSRSHDPSMNVVGVDHGLCGINSYYHPEIVNDPNFHDTEWQLRKCLELYRGGTTFYGMNRLHISEKNIIFH